MINDNQYHWRPARVAKVTRPRSILFATAGGDLILTGRLEGGEELEVADDQLIGLGNMGGPMAQNLVKAGHAVTGADVSADAVERLVAAGGQAADNVGAASVASDVIVTMLPSGREVNEIYLGADGIIAHALPGSLLIDCSTIDVETARNVAASAEAKGMMMVDAPVSGGVGGAQAGTLTFMVGGRDQAFEKARPILEAMGKTIVHAGGAGNGQAAKICNNMVLGISMIAVSAFVLAEKLGLDAQKLFDISSKSSGQCWSMTSYCPVPGPVPTSPANRDYQAGFTAQMMPKDLRLAQEAAQSVDRRPRRCPGAAVATPVHDQRAGGLDFSSIIKMLAGELPTKVADRAMACSLFVGWVDEEHQSRQPWRAPPDHPVDQRLHRRFLDVIETDLNRSDRGHQRRAEPGPVEHQQRTLTVGN